MGIYNKASCMKKFVSYGYIVEVHIEYYLRGEVAHL